MGDDEKDELSREVSVTEDDPEKSWEYVGGGEPRLIDFRRNMVPL